MKYFRAKKSEEDYGNGSLYRKEKHLKQTCSRCNKTQQKRADSICRHNSELFLKCTADRQNSAACSSSIPAKYLLHETYHASRDLIGEILRRCDGIFLVFRKIVSRYVLQINSRFVNGSFYGTPQVHSVYTTKLSLHTVKLNSQQKRRHHNLRFIHYSR